MVKRMSQSSKSCCLKCSLREHVKRERWSTCGALIYAPALSAQLSSATAPALLGWRLAFLLLWLLFVLPLFLLLLLCRYFFSISKWLQKLNTCFFSFRLFFDGVLRKTSLLLSVVVVALAVRLPSLTERVQSISR